MESQHGLPYHVQCASHEDMACHTHLQSQVGAQAETDRQTVAAMATSNIISNDNLSRVVDNQ